MKKKKTEEELIKEKERLYKYCIRNGWGYEWNWDLEADEEIIVKVKIPTTYEKEKR